MISLKTFLESAKVALFISVLTLGFGTTIYAEDLTDPATCMDCHEDADRAPPSDPNRPQVHNPEGGLFQEPHEDFVCVDCHTYIVDLEHEEYAPDKEVDCTECHDEAPTIE